MSAATILIVDDDPLNVRLVGDLLELHGYHVLHAGSGEASLETIDDRVPALVLMDIQLPGMSGIDAREALLARPDMAGAKFVALTASVMPHEIASFEVVGFDAFHPKPIDSERLLRLISDLLGERLTNTSSPPDTSP